MSGGKLRLDPIVFHDSAEEDAFQPLKSSFIKTFISETAD
jgi:hypothetical protein